MLSFGTFANADYSRLRKDDYEAIANDKFVDYIRDDRQQPELDASSILRILCCPCILTKYSHKFGSEQQHLIKNCKQQLSNEYRKQLPQKCISQADATSTTSYFLSPTFLGPP